MVGQGGVREKFVAVAVVSRLPLQTPQDQIRPASVLCKEEDLMTRKEGTHELSLQLVQLGLVTLELGRVRRPDRVGYTGQLNLQLGEELVRLVQVRGDLAQKTSEGLCGDGRMGGGKVRSEGWTKGGREARCQSIRPSLWKDEIVDAPPVKVLPSEASKAESLEVRWLKSCAYASKRPVGDWLEEGDASGRRIGTKEEESGSFQAGDERENAEHSLHAASRGEAGKIGKGV